jgi:hypothetical protein
VTKVDPPADTSAFGFESAEAGAVGAAAGVAFEAATGAAGAAGFGFGGLVIIKTMKSPSLKPRLENSCSLFKILPNMK